ncbi:MAG: hypothetical protein IT376_21065 [Polyangiaceae bacterium]|nr:hypothetical protein [Polyangiaceae bacterium]
MLTTEVIFNVIDSNAVNVVIGADRYPIQLLVEVIPGDGSAMFRVPSPTGPLWDVGGGAARRITIPPAQFMNDKFGAIRIRSVKDAGDPPQPSTDAFVAYVALGSPSITAPVTSQHFMGTDFRIPLLAVTPPSTQVVRLCLTAIETATQVMIKNLTDGAVLAQIPQIAPRASYLFTHTQNVDGELQVESLGGGRLVCSAFIERRQSFRLYPLAASF